MSIKDWTDKDYAQAAIDMLPDDPEMIGDFLRAQKISARGRCDAFGCPVTKWVNKWTDRNVATSRSILGSTKKARGDWEFSIPIPPHVAEFIRMFDAGMVRF